MQKTKRMRREEEKEDQQKPTWAWTGELGSFPSMLQSML